MKHPELLFFLLMVVISAVIRGLKDGRGRTWLDLKKLHFR